MNPTAALLEACLRALDPGVSVPPLHVGLLVLARLTPLTILGPLFLLRPAPPLGRAGVALVSTLALSPLAAAHANASLPSDALTPDALSLVVSLAVEVLRGALFALAIALPVVALEGAGQWLDTLRGAQQGGGSGPIFGGHLTPLGTWLSLFAVALFFAFGGHRVALEAFAAGFELVPVGTPLAGDAWPALAERSMRWVAAALALTVSIGAPAALALVLTELGMGLLGRTAPQLPLHFASMPLRASVGVLGLLLTLGVLVPLLPELFTSGIDEARTSLPLTR
ncbi:MAG: flagellar biosynthetic protein FliR [Polyangiales bacterium]